MSATRIAEIRARLAALSDDHPAPWHLQWANQDVQLIDATGEEVASWLFCIRPWVPTDKDECNLQAITLIAHAPADLQWLIDRIAVLETAARHVPKPRETDLMLGDDEWWWSLQGAIADIA